MPRNSGIIDTRDLQERLEELEAKRDAIDEAIEQRDETEADETASPEAFEKAVEELEKLEADFDEDEQKELAELESLSEEISEWKDGATMIPESEFVEYCQELLEDIGDLPKDLPGYIAIDWEKTADNLRADYSEVEYQGTTYLVRY
jgi:predicted nuclease with TOPRIM domain